MSGRTTNKFNKILSQLHQEVINARMDNNEVFDNGENNLPENIDNLNIEMIRDLGTTSTLKNVSNIFRLVAGADHNDILRIHLKFSNAGKLYDYARNNNTSWVFGLGQIPILIKKKVPDNVLGYEFQSFFNGQDQFAYTEDNTLVQIRPFFDDGNLTDISFFDSFSPVSISHTLDTENSVLFTKIDDDQLKDGYAATINNKGDIFFYIRRNFKQYSLFIRGIYSDQLQDELTNGGDFLATNYNYVNYQTDKEYTSNLVCSIVKTDDHWFCYKKSTNVMKYFKNGADFTPSGLSVSPVLDVPFQDGAYNTDGSDRTVINDISGNDYNGTLSNPENGQWQTNNTFFNFGGNTAGNGGGCKISFPTISELDSATEFTISFMYKPDNVINTHTWFETIVNKNWQTDGSFILYRPPNSGNIVLEYRSPTGIKDFVTVVGGVTTTDWHSIIIKIKASESIELIIDGISNTGGILDTTVTSTGVLEIGSVTTGLRGTICYFRVFTSKLDANDTQRLIDEGYHNPTFPKAEKPQPEPDPTPDPIINPFEVFYNLPTGVLNDANTVWLNDPAGNSPFTPFYNVTEGQDINDPEQLIYDIDDGQGSAGDPFVERYNFAATGGGGGGGSFSRIAFLDSSNNSSGKIGDNVNDAMALEVDASNGSGIGDDIVGKVITRAIFWMRKANSGSFSGTLYCRIWNTNNSLNPVATLGSVSADSLDTGDFAAYTFTNESNSVTMQEGYRVGIEYVGAGDSDVVDVQRRASNVDDTVIQASFDNGSWDTNGDFEVKCDLYQGGTGSDSLDLSPNNGRTIGGIRVLNTSSDIHGHKITKAHFWLKGTNSPIGSVYCRIWDNNGNVVATLQRWNGSSLETLSAQNIPSSFTEFEFRNTTSSYGTMGTVWTIGIEYTTGSGSDTVSLRRQGGNPKANEIQDSVINGSWQTDSNYDVGAKLYTGTVEGNPDPYIYMQHESFSPYDRVMQKFGSGDSCLNSIPTKVKIKLKRTGTCNGTIKVQLVTTYNGTTKTEFGSGIAASSIATTGTEYTFTNLDNEEAILTDYVIRIYWDGLDSSSTGTIGVLSNSGVVDDHNGTTSHLQRYGQFDLTNYTTLDLSGKIYTGGGDFTAHRDFSSSLTRVYAKVAHTSSTLNNKKITKIIGRMKKVGLPTGFMTCNVRKLSDDSVRFSLGSVDVSGISDASVSDVEFMNVFNELETQLDDRICFEYLGADASNYVEVYIDQDVFETTNTIAGTYSSPVYSDNAQIDLAAKMYTGGEPDVDSRTRVGQKIVTNDSTMDGKKLTKIGVWMKNPNGAVGNIHCMIFRASDDAQPIVTLGDPIGASTIGTSYQYVEFEDTTNGYVMDVNDKVCIQFEAGSPDQQIGVHVRDGTNYDSTHSHLVRYNGETFDDRFTWDLVATMWTGGDEYQPPANAIPDPTPTNNKDLLYCAGNNLLSGFARVLQREFAIYVEDTTEQEATNVYTNRYSKTLRSPQEVLTVGSFKPY